MAFFGMGDVEVISTREADAALQYHKQEVLGAGNPVLKVKVGFVVKLEQPYIKGLVVSYLRAELCIFEGKMTHFLCFAEA